MFLAASAWAKQTVQAADPSIVQSTYADFTQPGAILSGTHVIEPAPGDGSIVLSAQFSDDFPGTALDGSLWSGYLWSDGTSTYAPTIENSILTIPANAGAFVTSNNTFQPPTTTLATTLEFTANFGDGENQHIGFASDKFEGNKLILFSTNTAYSGDLFARLNNNGEEQFADLGPIPTGYHLYRIEWILDSGDLTGTTDDAFFYIDGSQVAALHIQGSVSLPGLYTYISNSGAAPLNVDFLQVSPPYNGSTGSYTSSVLDAAPGNIFTTVSWTATESANTALTVETRSSMDQLSWSSFAPVTNGDPVPSEGRYLQYKLTLSSGDSNLTPQLDDITLSYGLPQVDLKVVKSGPTSVAAGGDVTYILSVSNLGPNTASGINLSDTLPAGLTNVSVQGGAGWDCSGTSGLSVSCSLASLAVGAAPDVTVTATAPAEGGDISNTANVIGVETDPDPSNNASTLGTTVTPVADLKVVKSGPTMVDAAGVMTYTLSVSNLGPSTATGVNLTDSLPTGLTNVSVPEGLGWDCSGSSGLSVNCSLASLAVGAAPDVTVTATAPAEGGDISNTADVSGVESDPDPSNNAGTVDTTVAPVADLAIQITASPDPVGVGRLLTYHVSVNNLGPSTASNVNVSDTLPSGLVFVSAMGIGWLCDDVSGTVGCSMASLSASSSGDIAIQVYAPLTTGSIDNSVNVSADPSDPVSGNNTKGVTVHVIGIYYLPVIIK